jgi:hypothetical protein
MRLPLALFASAALSLAAARAAQPETTKVFGNWTASCNNLGACAVMGAAADGEGLVYLRLSREAGAGAAPGIKLVFGVPDGAEKKGPFDQFRLTALTGKGKAALAPVPAKAAADDASYISATLAPDAALALIDAVRNADRLEAAIGPEKSTIDLKGFSAALRFVDDRQGRAGGPTALIAKGMTPPGNVPPPTPAPAVTPAPAGSVEEVAKPAITPALLAAPAAGCDADTLAVHDDLKAWSVAPDRVLVSVPCQSGAYNFTGVLYFTNAKGEPLGPVPLPRPAGQDPAGQDADTPKNAVVNGDFDPKTMVLSEFAKGRGIGDCGSSTQWVWTGKDFALLSANAIDACPGGFPQDWPNLYTAVKR